MKPNLGSADPTVAANSVPASLSVDAVVANPLCDALLGIAAAGAIGPLTTACERLRAENTQLRAQRDELAASNAELLRELEHLARLLEPALNSGQAQVPGLATVNAAWLAIAKARALSRSTK